MGGQTEARYASKWGDPEVDSLVEELDETAGRLVERDKETS